MGIKHSSMPCTHTHPYQEKATVNQPSVPLHVPATLIANHPTVLLIEEASRTRRQDNAPLSYSPAGSLNRSIVPPSPHPLPPPPQNRTKHKTPFPPKNPRAKWYIPHLHSIASHSAPLPRTHTPLPSHSSHHKPLSIFPSFHTQNQGMHAFSISFLSRTHKHNCTWVFSSLHNRTKPRRTQHNTAPVKFVSPSAEAR